MKYSIFDICNTLYYSNTTFDFIEFVLNKSGDDIQLKKLKNLKSRKSLSFYINYFILKVLHVDLYKKNALKQLKGLKKEVLYEYAEAFYNEFLIQRKIKESFDILNAAKTKNEKILLISNTIEPIAEVIAEKLNVYYYSSLIRYTNNIFTGIIIEDLAWQKHKIVRKHIQPEDVITVITDNISDFKLVKMADYRYVILYNQKNRNKWDSLNPTYIELKT